MNRGSVVDPEASPPIQVRFCDCQEEVAETADFTWDKQNPRDTGKATNAHTHEGCRVYHKGTSCTINRGEKGASMAKRKGNGKDVEVIDGHAPKGSRRGRGKKAAAADAGKGTAHLPGMEPKTIPSVHNAIEEYVDVRERRSKLAVIESEKKAHLMQVMKKAGITSYHVDGHRATLESEEKVKAGLDSDEREEHEESAIRGGSGARVDSVSA